MEIKQDNIVQTAYDAGLCAAANIESFDGMPYVIHGKEQELKLMPELRSDPLRIENSVKHNTAKSFIDYYNLFSSSKSAIFFDNDAGSFEAVLDYHALGSPGWMKHKSTFKAIQTKEWDLWTYKEKQVMTQEEFGLFIEHNLLDIIEPTGADMLEIALTIQANKSVKFSNSIRLNNGQTQLTYNEVIEGSAGATGQFKIPETFRIGLRLYEGSDPYSVDCRLRYRIKDGSLTLWYELIRAHVVIDSCLGDIYQEIAVGCKNATIFSGSLI